MRLHVLHHADEGEIWGTWLATELARHGYEISPGTLYPALHRMEEQGLLTSRQATVEGRRHRLYRITPTGRRLLVEGRQVLAELTTELLP